MSLLKAFARARENVQNGNAGAEKHPATQHKFGLALAGMVGLAAAGPLAAPTPAHADQESVLRAKIVAMQQHTRAMQQGSRRYKAETRQFKAETGQFKGEVRQFKAEASAARSESVCTDKLIELVSSGRRKLSGPVQPGRACATLGGGPS